MASDNRCQVSEELEIRLRFLESSLNKWGMILDALQSDVMHLNRAVKEVSLDVETIRQKMNILDNSMQQVLKEEESIKAFLDGSMKSISDQMMKEVDRNKINDIATAIPTLPKQIEAQLHGFQREIYVIITKSIEVLTNNMKFAINNFSEAISSREANSCIPIRRQQNSQKSECHLIRSTFSSLDHTRKVAVLKKEENALNVLKSQMNNSSKSTAVKHSLVPLVQQEQIIIESDNEDDGSLCCIPVKKEKGALSKENQLDNEAKEETLRILQKARKRKRRQSNYICIM
ncbi:hypothetical protein HPP92_008291 [Vanilla planifolia]|nr:hypothetical protein HPP92_008291 [Vanilla planifolia]